MIVKAEWRSQSHAQAGRLQPGQRKSLKVKEQETVVPWACFFFIHFLFILLHKFTCLFNQRFLRKKAHEIARQFSCNNSLEGSAWKSSINRQIRLFRLSSINQ
jgi:lysozyme family protein